MEAAKEKITKEFIRTIKIVWTCAHNINLKIDAFKMNYLTSDVAFFYMDKCVCAIFINRRTNLIEGAECISVGYKNVMSSRHCLFVSRYCDGCAKIKYKKDEDDTMCKQCHKQISKKNSCKLVTKYVCTECSMLRRHFYHAKENYKNKATTAFLTKTKEDTLIAINSYHEEFEYSLIICCMQSSYDKLITQLSTFE